MAARLVEYGAAAGSGVLLSAVTWWAWSVENLCLPLLRLCLIQHKVGGTVPESRSAGHPLLRTAGRESRASQPRSPVGWWLRYRGPTPAAAGPRFSAKELLDGGSPQGSLPTTSLGMLT